MSKDITNELLLEEIRRNRQELKATIEAFEVRFLMQIDEQKQRINTIEKHHLELEGKIESIDKKQREKNIVLFGLQHKPQEITVAFIIDEIKKLLSVNLSELDINNVYPLGNNQTCPIKIEFVSYLKKTDVLKSAKKLKGTNIYAVNDLTVKQREENKTLRKYLSEAKQEGKRICYIKKNKLHIDDQIYTAQELKQLEDLDEENATKASVIKKQPIQAITSNLEKPRTRSVNKPLHK